MKIRWLITVMGAVEGHPDGARPGLIMDLPPERAEAYIQNGYATRDLDGPLPPFMGKPR